MGIWSHLRLIFQLLHSLTKNMNTPQNTLYMALRDGYEECADGHCVVMMIWVLVAKMMMEKFEFLFLEAVCLIRSFIVQIVFPKNDLSEVSWWGIYGLRGRKTINCFCQTRTRAFRFHRLLCFNQTPRRRC